MDHFIVWNDVDGWSRRRYNDHY